MTLETDKDTDTKAVKGQKLDLVRYVLRTTYVSPEGNVYHAGSRLYKEEELPEKARTSRYSLKLVNEEVLNSKEFKGTAGMETFVDTNKADYHFSLNEEKDPTNRDEIKIEVKDPNASKSSYQPKKLNINTATPMELSSLGGNVTPKIAEKIETERKKELFKDVNDLQKRVTLKDGKWEDYSEVVTF